VEKTCEFFALVLGSARCGQSLGKATGKGGDGQRLGKMERFMGGLVRVAAGPRQDTQFVVYTICGG